MTQNARGLPDVSKDAYGSTAIHQDEYAYDQVGNVLSITDAATGQNQKGNRDMAYDGLNRLTSVSAPDMFGIASYAYDVQDNLKHVQVTAGSQPRNVDYCYDAANRLTNVTLAAATYCGGATVTGLGYDVQGNLANKDGVLYAFDQGNRLRSVSGALGAYLYDGHGRRVQDTVGGAAKRSQYTLSGQLVMSGDDRAGKVREYISLGGSLVLIRERDIATGDYTMLYQHNDALGSPVAVTTETRALVERREYEPYGYQTAPFALKDGPGYTGHVTDAATGLVYMQQRYYDPAVGQHFLSVDPVTAYSPGGAFNQYWYANANPYGLTDPDGRDPGDNNSSQTDPYLRQQQIDEARRRAQERQEQEERARQAARHGRISIPRFCESRADCAIIEAQERYVNGEISKGELDDIYEAQGVGALIGLGLVSTGAALVEVAPPTAAALAKTWKNLSFDGPSPGLAYAQGRIAQVRWKGGSFVIRLDLHSRVPGGPSVLHINYGPVQSAESRHLDLWTFGK